MAHENYTVTWSPEDSEYIATTPSFPELSWCAPMPVTALAGLMRLIGETRRAAALPRARL